MFCCQLNFSHPKPTFSWKSDNGYLPFLYLSLFFLCEANAGFSMQRRQKRDIIYLFLSQGLSSIGLGSVISNFNGALSVAIHLAFTEGYLK